MRRGNPQAGDILSLPASQPTSLVSSLSRVVIVPGKMSKFLGELKVGDAVAFKGPIPKYPYKANSKKEIGMVAGGEGRWRAWWWWWGGMRASRTWLGCALSPCWCSCRCGEQGVSCNAT
jgi:hypothetical protein